MTLQAALQKPTECILNYGSDEWMLNTTYQMAAVASLKSFTELMPIALTGFTGQLKT